MPAEQLNFPFPSLDFPGRVSLYPHEVAEKLSISLDQVYKLVDDGSLRTTINLASKLNRTSRRELRIPIESYRDLIITRTEGDHRLDLMKQLPKAALRDLQRDIAKLLSA